MSAVVVHLLDGRTATVEEYGIDHTRAWCGVRCNSDLWSGLDVDSAEAIRGSRLPDKVTCAECSRLLVAAGYLS